LHLAQLVPKTSIFTIFSIPDCYEIVRFSSDLKLP
jgi:hypothetical protein